MGKVHEPDQALVGGMLAAVIRLISRWSSLEVQRAVAADAGVTIEATDIRALYVLGLHGGALRPSALAGELQVSRPTASKMLLRLDAEGLTERSADPDDGRAALIVLSAAGREAFRHLYDAGIDMMRESLQDWSDDERVPFPHLLTRFVDGLMRVPHTSQNTR